MDNVKAIGHFYVLGCSWRYTGMIHLLFVLAVSRSWLFFIFIIIGLYCYYSIMFLVIDVYWCTSVMLFFCIILVLFITDHLFTWRPANDTVALNCIVCLQDQYTCNIIAPLKHSLIPWMKTVETAWELSSVQTYFSTSDLCWTVLLVKLIVNWSRNSLLFIESEGSFLCLQ